MADLAFIYRADKNNVGDWWSIPQRYFTFRPADTFDIKNINANLSNYKSIIVGGGGLGRPGFQTELNYLQNNGKNIIGWGIGADTFENSRKILTPPPLNYDFTANYFDAFDVVGTRIFNLPGSTYVPCASCMSNLFFKYRDMKPKHTLGLYSHPKAYLTPPNTASPIPHNDNKGNNLEEKLQFLASCETVVTNTYHGVYWSLLLERKVVCIPFKSGLFTFKHKPVYADSTNITDSLIAKATTYSGLLEECRKLNIMFYSDIANNFEVA